MKKMHFVRIVDVNFVSASCVRKLAMGVAERIVLASVVVVNNF
jgi:hypothetical protein